MSAPAETSRAFVDLNAFCRQHEGCQAYVDTERPGGTARHGAIRLRFSVLADGMVAAVAWCVACEDSICRQWMPARDGWPPSWIGEAAMRDAVFPEEA